jgi:hypothetical protein
MAHSDTSNDRGDQLIPTRFVLQILGEDVE